MFLDKDKTMVNVQKYNICTALFEPQPYFENFARLHPVFAAFDLATINK
jgi:hypothetical protein